MEEPERLNRLSELPISEPVRRLATGDLPHEAFLYRCGPLMYSPKDRVWPVEPAEFVALWECCYTVTGCRRRVAGWEFAALDVEDPLNAEVISTSEQGLLFWLFSSLIEDQDWHDERATEEYLKAAADSVGFRYFDELDRFQRRFGSCHGYRDLLRQEARRIK